MAERRSQKSARAEVEAVEKEWLAKKAEVDEEAAALKVKQEDLEKFRREQIVKMVVGAQFGKDELDTFVAVFKDMPGHADIGARLMAQARDAKTVKLDDFYTKLIRMGFYS